MVAVTNRKGANLGAERVGGGGASVEVLGNERAEEALVDGARAAGVGELEPEDECGLEDKVVREVVENKAERKRLKEVEEAKYGPVGEPVAVGD